MMLRCLIALLLLVMAAGAQDDPSFAKDAETLPTTIESVVTDGYWKRDHRDGQYRLIIEVLGFDTLYSRAFLQWISPDPDRQETVVERTVPIKQIAGRWRISSHKFEQRDKQTVIVISAERMVPPGKAIFTITPTVDYTYKITTSEK
jgi:hypothetical protein